MTYDEWERYVPEGIKGDALWKVEAYRLALFAGDLAWPDVTKLIRDRRTVELASQLYRALGSVSANIAEGYSRGTGKDRARFYEYALGSARESREWYYKGRHVLTEKVALHRIGLLTQAVRLLLVMIAQQPGHTLRDAAAEYRAPLHKDGATGETIELADLLDNVPMP